MYAEYNIMEKGRLKSVKNELGVKVTDLAALVKGREQEVADLDVVVTSVKLQNDSLADQVHKLEVFAVELQEKVAVYEDCMSQLCLNSIEHLSVLGATISKVVEKGMQEGLSAGITHGAKDRKLVDVAVYNPFAEADYLPALQRLQNVNFSLIAKLKSNKDTSVDTIINLLRLDDTFAERLGMKGTFSYVNTTTALSVTFVSAGTILPISTDDYKVAHADGQEDADVGGETIADENVDPFSDVADIPCSMKGVSITVSKPVCSLAQCFPDFVWSFPLRSELAPVFRMACFIASVDKVSWTEACASEPGVVILFYFGFAPCFLLQLALFFSKRSKLISKASLFLTMSTSAVLKVGMLISAGITAFAP
nr:nonaspanin [Tanacetum cinerariifolium]